jgi:hypothetical protein
VYTYRIQRYSYRARNSDAEVAQLVAWPQADDDIDELPHIPHGTATMYRWGRCRCVQCRERKSADAKDYRRRRRQQV